MKVFFSIGEVSASNYIYEIFKELGGIEAWGITDERLESIGFKSVAKIQDLSVVGIVEAIPKIPFVLRLYKRIEELLPEMDALVLCDAPAFNLPLLKRARGKVKKIIYFISPQVWAWRSSRAKTIAELVDDLIVILPFEVDFYRSYARDGLRIHYLGHPLVDVAKPTKTREEFIKLVGHEKVLGVLPGSRWSEIKRHAPYLRSVILELWKDFGLYSVIPTFEPFVDYLKETLKDTPVKIISKKEGSAYDVMAYSVFSLVASGTAELEASLLLNPHLVFYRVHPLTYLIGKRLVKVKWVSLTNLILNKEVVPELVQKLWIDIYKTAKKLIDSPKALEEMRENFLTLREVLGKEGVINRLRELFLGVLA